MAKIDKDKFDFFWKCFISWMKIQGIYNQFKHNHDNCGNDWIKTYYNCDEKILKYSIDPENWIQWSFKWEGTKEGADFWHLKGVQWYRFFTSNRKKIEEARQADRLYISKLIN